MSAARRRELAGMCSAQGGLWLGRFRVFPGCRRQFACRARPGRLAAGRRRPTRQRWGVERRWTRVSSACSTSSRGATARWQGARAVPRGRRGRPREIRRESLCVPGATARGAVHPAPPSSRAALRFCNRPDSRRSVNRAGFRGRSTDWPCGTAVAQQLLMTVTFLGTKGGTGTTTMAVNLGAEIRRVTMERRCWSTSSRPLAMSRSSWACAPDSR